MLDSPRKQRPFSRGKLGVRLLAGAVVAAVILAGVLSIVCNTSIKDPPASKFEPSSVAQGAALAELGDCEACHTAPGGSAFAGGRPMATPFGTIYSTNITPSPDTGIGGWSERAFARAMREGVSQDGHHLYPAFPYTHFSKLTDNDVQALYAFMMTRQPVRATTPSNLVTFPFNFRALVAGWNLLFLDDSRFSPDPSRSAEWNRGAYLAEGLSGCGGCHTPRNLLGAEKSKQAYAGGDAEGWRALALDADQPAPVPWDADALLRYLRTGSDPDHAVAAGPMQEVADHMARAPERDVRAISVYIASVSGPAHAKRSMRAARAGAVEQSLERPQEQIGSASLVPESGRADSGAEIYRAACASCHQDEQGVRLSARSLALHPNLYDVRPTNLLRVIMDGIHPHPGMSYYLMPGFSTILTDEQVAALAAYLRAAFTDQPSWPQIDQEVHRVRSQAAR
jgi:mono/diheme cytochrome c family protein